MCLGYFCLVYNQLAVRPLPPIHFQGSQSLNMLEGKYFDQKFFKGFSIVQKIQVLMINIKYPKWDKIISSSDLEIQQTMNTDRAERFAKCYKNVSNCSTGGKKLIKLLLSRCSSYTLLQLPSVTLRYKNYISKKKPVFAVPELSLWVIEKTTLQCGLQRLSKLSDMAENYFSFPFFFFFANIFTS